MRPPERPFAEVVVGFAFQRSVTPFARNAPKLCPADPVKRIRIVSQAILPSHSGGQFRRSASRRLCGGHCGSGSRISTGARFSKAGSCLLDQLIIECLFASRDLAPARSGAPRAPATRRVVQNRGKVDAARLPVIDGGLHIKHVDAADHFVHSAKAQLRHVLPHLLGKKEKEIDDMLGLALELLAQRRILRGNSDRTGIQMALAQHDAAHGDQRRGGKTELLRAEQRGDHHVAAGLQLAVGLYADCGCADRSATAPAAFRQARVPKAFRRV